MISCVAKVAIDLSSVLGRGGLERVGIETARIRSVSDDC